MTLNQNTIKLHEYVDQLIPIIQESHTKDMYKKTEINGNDMLIIVDMQYDFMKDGSFAVPEGEHIVPALKRVINIFKQNNAHIIFTRDYHPADHISFGNNKDKFPPHCVFGTHGSEIHHDLLTDIDGENCENKISVSLKGFYKDCDSFGAIKYKKEYADTRLQYNDHIRDTGSFIFLNESILHCAIGNVPEPSIIENPRIRTMDYIKDNRINRIFVCGLAGDFCVLDTMINIKEYLSETNVSLIIDLTRFANVNNEFITPPKIFGSKINDYNINIVTSYIF